MVTVGNLADKGYEHFLMRFCLYRLRFDIYNFPSTARENEEHVQQVDGIMTEPSRIAYIITKSFSQNTVHTTAQKYSYEIQSHLQFFIETFSHIAQHLNAF